MHPANTCSTVYKPESDHSVQGKNARPRTVTMETHNAATVPRV